MNTNYFQDTLVSKSPTLTAPGLGSLVQVAVNDLFATKNYTLIVVVANINNTVTVRLDGSIDGVNFAPLIANQTIAANGPHIFNSPTSPVVFVRPNFVSESGGNTAEVTFNVAAL